MKPELPEEDLKRITDSLIAGNKIDAIKTYRKATGQGLKEAKEAIDDILESLASAHPDLLKKNSSGCAALIILGSILCYGTFEISQRLL